MKVRRLRWYMAALLMLATTVNYLDRQTLSVAAPVIREQFGLSNQDYGAITSAFLLAYGLMHPVAGRIIDWIGTRAGFALAVIWWSVANVAHAFAGGFRSLAAMRFLLGIGEAGNFPGAIKCISEWFPANERTVATGIMNVGAGAGAVIAPPLVGWLVWAYGWQVAFVVTGLMGFAWVALWMMLYQHPDRHPSLTEEERGLIHAGHHEHEFEAGSGKGVWKEALRCGSLWALMLARFISDPGWFFYLLWLPNYLSSARGFDLKTIAMFAWMPYLGADFGSLIGGFVSAYLIRRGFSIITARKLAMAIFAAMMPVAIAAVRAESPYVAILFITVATTAHQAWAASLLTLPADLFPRRAVASAYGLTGMCGMLGSALFSPIVGRIVDSFGYVPVFTLVGFLHPVAATIIVVFVRPRPRGPLAGVLVRPV